MQALRQGKNALLESPTGTGKTLALLCAALAYQRQQRIDIAAALKVEVETAALKAHRDKLAERTRTAAAAAAGSSGSGGGGSGGNGDGGSGDVGGDSAGSTCNAGSSTIIGGSSAGSCSSSSNFPVHLAYEEDVTFDNAPSRAAAVVTPETAASPVAPSDEPAAARDSDDDAFESPKKKKQKKQKRAAAAVPKGAVAEEPSGGITAGVHAGVGGKEVAKGVVSVATAAPEGDKAAVADGSKAGGVQGGAGGVDGGVGDAAAKEAASAAPVLKLKRQKVPTIIFASRTHSQLGQVIGELRSCSGFLNHVAAGFHINPPTSTSTSAHGGAQLAALLPGPFRMTLLSSRAHSCIDKRATSLASGVDEGCRTALRERTCARKHRTAALRSQLPQVWDIEEAVEAGGAANGCPYFAAKEALVDAQLVLCPYNYVVDPTLRRIMNINLADSIILFDEAHNLADFCRSAASLRLPESALADAVMEMSRLCASALISGAARAAYVLLHNALSAIGGWLTDAAKELRPYEFETEARTWSGEQALGILGHRAGITAESAEQLESALQLISAEQEQDAAGDMAAAAAAAGGGGDAQQSKLSAPALNVVSGVITAARFMLGKESTNAAHYKMAVIRERDRSGGGGGDGGRRGVRRGRGSKEGSGGGSSGGGSGGGGGRMVMYWCLWCLSASVCFEEIAEQARSVVLTSGTLSPMDSFASELGVPFPIQLEAGHVIDVRQQCFVASVGACNGVSLKATFGNQGLAEYQDALGAALLNYARVVRGGVLVFFPSYGLLARVRERWELTGLLAQMQASKAVLEEPRAASDVEAVMRDFNVAVEGARKGGAVGGGAGGGGGGGGSWAERQAGKNGKVQGGGTGAILLAVCRGKVSEGIDFSDDYARLVIVVGIPYPSFKDLLVVAKKAYQNARHARDKAHLSGDAWYSQEAFRALNQAMGRCIRHRADFGAIILADPRFQFSGVQGGLSKWVRAQVQRFDAAEGVVEPLKRFFEAQAPLRALQPQTCKSDAGGGGGGASAKAAAAAAAAGAKTLFRSPTPGVRKRASPGTAEGERPPTRGGGQMTLAQSYARTPVAAAAEAAAAAAMCPAVSPVPQSALVVASPYAAASGGSARSSHGGDTIDLTLGADHPMTMRQGSGGGSGSGAATAHRAFAAAAAAAKPPAAAAAAAAPARKPISSGWVSVRPSGIKAGSAVLPGKLARPFVPVRPRQQAAVQPAQAVHEAQQAPQQHPYPMQHHQQQHSQQQQQHAQLVIQQQQQQQQHTPPETQHHVALGFNFEVAAPTQPFFSAPAAAPPPAAAAAASAYTSIFCASCRSMCADLTVLDGMHGGAAVVLPVRDRKSFFAALAARNWASGAPLAQQLQLAVQAHAAVQASLLSAMRPYEVLEVSASVALPAHIRPCSAEPGLQGPWQHWSVYDGVSFEPMFCYLCNPPQWVGCCFPAAGAGKSDMMEKMWFWGGAVTSSCVAASSGVGGESYLEVGAGGVAAPCSAAVARHAHAVAITKLR
ncbi:helicase C-terminal domain-containing protein [Tribonema minus]|uniref:Helicase C-terminal domain-containing protein n=1 Tax=Tribonema minus TaxID=303371 RepID=A0A835ZF85_9STRA|nr:helicase C-terminal domain-containing protein [Tribonema minus]